MSNCKGWGKSDPDGKSSEHVLYQIMKGDKDVVLQSFLRSSINEINKNRISGDIRFFRVFCF